MQEKRPLSSPRQERKEVEGGGRVDLLLRKERAVGPRLKADLTGYPILGSPISMIIYDPHVSVIKNALVPNDDARVGPYPITTF